MYHALRRFYMRIGLLFCFFTGFLHATAQPPLLPNVPVEISPNQIDPKNLSQPQLRALLELSLIHI